MKTAALLCLLVAPAARADAQWTVHAHVKYQFSLQHFPPAHVRRGRDRADAAGPDAQRSPERDVPPRADRRHAERPALPPGRRHGRRRAERGGRERRRVSARAAGPRRCPSMARPDGADVDGRPGGADRPSGPGVDRLHGGSPRRAARPPGVELGQRPGVPGAGPVQPVPAERARHRLQARPGHADGAVAAAGGRRPAGHRRAGPAAGRRRAGGGRELGGREMAPYRRQRGRRCAGRPPRRRRRRRGRGERRPGRRRLADRPVARPRERATA